ncbi:hypothetical protein [Nitrosopumilus sp.]|uniref:hypothetical protein n=1 Tax=Nitrosopumilus sp. TaxID=2024843 RepID=UPI00292E109D|nr:hypothetical protein [Nitrosopumilus sp.]
MMVNHLDDNSDYGEITLDSVEPFAQKIIEHFAHKETLEILELTQTPNTICDICTRLSYSKATLYRRVSDLLDTCLLFAIKKQNTSCKKYGSWMYVKSFYAISVRCGPICNCDNSICTVVEILPKREFYGKILKAIRNSRL